MMEWSVSPKYVYYDIRENFYNAYCILLLQEIITGRLQKAKQKIEIK